MRWILVLIVAFSLIFIPVSSASAGCTVRSDWTNWHTVARGENLYRVATRYGTTIGEMTVGNCLIDPNRIYVGQVLRVPSGGNPTGTQGYIAGSFIRLRMGPGEQYRVIRFLSNQAVQILGKSSNLQWYKVQAGGYTGWVFSQLVTIDPNVYASIPIVS